MKYNSLCGGLYYVVVGLYLGAYFHRNVPGDLNIRR